MMDYNIDELAETDQVVEEELESESDTSIVTNGEAIRILDTFFLTLHVISHSIIVCVFYAIIIQ